MLLGGQFARVAAAAIGRNAGVDKLGAERFDLFAGGGAVRLPIRNAPVLTPALALDGEVSAGAVARKYNMQGMPTSFFIDRAGIVRAANMGAMSRAYIEAQIEALSK